MALQRNIPKRPTGITPFHVWCEAVHDRVFTALRFNDSPTGRFQQGQKGISAEAAPGGGSGTTVKLCVVTKLYGTAADAAFDYMMVTPWNPTAIDPLTGLPTGALSGAPFTCAKSLTEIGRASCRGQGGVSVGAG